jgi:hypothetical protein
MADDVSVASMPSHKPAGFHSFKLKSFVKDPQLQQSLLSSDGALDAAFRKAGLDPDARAGVLIKYALKNTLDEHHYTVVSSYNVSCHSTRGPINPR